jgi:TPR repeat protein
MEHIFPKELSDSESHQHLDGDASKDGSSIPPNQSTKTNTARPQKDTALMEKAALGHTHARCCVCDAYTDGQSVTKTHKKVVNWFEKVAVQRHAAAHHCLGDAYYNGQGFMHDYRAELELFDKVAAQGQAEAQCSFGFAV